MLVVLDGFGLSEQKEGNAINEANPEFINKLLTERPCGSLNASGLSVGLPEGQMGNSEVGHLNIGAGRIVYQDITRIHRSIEEGDFFDNKVLNDLIDQVKNNGKALHLFGLVSDGGVHSHQTHIYALLELAAKKGLKKVFIHAFTDGRDTSPTSGVHFLKQLVDKAAEIGVGQVATISGRYYAMDRDNRWERIEKAYQAIVHGVGNRASDPVLAIEASYKVNVTDEFIKPVVMENGDSPIATVEQDDGIIAFNFRADRMRQITKVFTAEQFDHFKRCDMSVNYVTFTKYAGEFNVPVVFEPQSIKNTLGEVISAKGLNQFRLAETEKYAHVTYFTNGGREEPFPNEDRHMIPSPKVKTYDLKPEMSAFEVGEHLVDVLRTEKYSFVMVNFANCDMVGHTGVMDATIKAVNTVDSVLAKVVPAAYELGYDCLITADHGNAEQMFDMESGEAFTEHTVNKVPICLLSRTSYKLRSLGALCDIAPTILELLEIDQPAEMSGKSLLEDKEV